VDRLVVVWVLACGCGFRPSAGRPGDGGLDPDADAATQLDADATILPSTCMARWLTHTIQFQPPTRLGLSATTSFERDPFLSHDEKTIYFSSNRSPATNADIFVATRPNLGAAFGSPTRFTVANDAAAYDGKLAMSTDELTFVVSSDRTGTQGGADLWVSVRTALGNGFGIPSEIHLGNVDDAKDQEDPVISTDKLRLYLAPQSVATNQQHIVMATRATEQDDFDAPVAIAELDSGLGDADPALTDDERLIVFSSNRPGGSGGIDLWYATRANATAAFTTPANLGAVVNGGGNDGDPWISPDGCRLYFASDTLGDNDLWVAVAQ
jgi:Tol biopolymer transport system component